MDRSSCFIWLPLCMDVRHEFLQLFSFSYFSGSLLAFGIIMEY